MLNFLSGDASWERLEGEKPVGIEGFCTIISGSGSAGTTETLLQDPITMKVYRKRSWVNRGGGRGKDRYPAQTQCAWFVFAHPGLNAKSNSYVRMGTDCAEEVDANYDVQAVAGLRRVIAQASERKAGKAKAQVVLDGAGISAAWTIYETCQALFEAKNGGEIQDEERTVHDIVTKLIKYGSVSEKASGYVRSLLTRIDKRVEIAAARKVENDAALPVPTGPRIEVEGIVLMTKVQTGGLWRHDQDAHQG